MRQRGISYTDCRNRYGIGHSTITLIMDRFRASGKDLEALKQMSAEEVEELIYPPENIIRKDISVMPDYQAVYEHLSKPGSKANLFYLWLKYKKECPAGYQYTQYCHYFKKFVEKNYGSEAVSMVVERIPGEKVYIEQDGKRRLLDRCKKPTVFLRVTIDSRQNRHEFSISNDGRHFAPVGQPFALRMGYWKGSRIGLYSYNNSGANPGVVHFDYFRYDVTR